MREVRPTIKLLKSLPRDSFVDTSPLDLIASSDFRSLDLFGIQQPLLDDARRRFSTGVPDRHVLASKAYGKPVYEVRDREGAGWRGAVVLDNQGDPWLVWAERHNQFHKKVANVDFASRLPTSAEYKLRDREEVAATQRDWERDVLTAFLETLRQSVTTAQSAHVTLSGNFTGSTATLTVETEHDEPSEDLAQAQDGQSLVTVSLKITGEGGGAFQAALTRVCLPFLEPNAALIEAVFGHDNSLNVCVDVSHAQIIQLLSDPSPYDAAKPMAVAPPNRLHYVRIDYLVDGYVNSVPLRGVCGVWFVASRSGECGLPVCERCEAEEPAAQYVLNVIRSDR